MVTTLELQRRGLRYAVVVDGAATPASLQALDRQGLPYLVEVADGATMASRRALEARGLRYLVPVLVDASPASKASLAAQGLRYAVQVDADILPTDRLVLQRQGLACYVEVDSSGNSVSAAAVGGAALLTGEANGFATDFTHPVDAERVALKTAGTVVSSGTSFFTSSGTSSKWVYNAAGVLVNIPAGTLPLDYDPVTHVAKGLLCEPQATNLALQSAMGRPGFLWTGNSSTFTGGQPDPSGGSEALQVQVTGNASGNNVNEPIAVVNGTTYTRSAWCKGTAGQQIYFDNDSAASQVLVTFTGAWQRVSTTSAATSSVLYLAFECYNRSGGAHLPNVTFQCWGGQLEAGTVASSYIPTLAATVTRAADKVSVTPASIGHSATAGSWWLETYLMGGASDEWIIGSASAAGPLLYNVGGLVIRDGTQIYIPPGPSLINNINKLMSAFATGSRAVTYNGQAPTTDAGTVTNLLTPTYVGFGCSAAGLATMRGYIRKVRYLPRRPTNAELSAMTA